MKRGLPALLALALCAACEDDTPVVRLSAAVMPDGARLDGEGDRQRLVLPLGAAGIFGLRADRASDEGEPEELGLQAVRTCDDHVIDVRRVESAQHDGDFDGRRARRYTLAGNERPAHEPHRLALLAARPGTSCLEVDSSLGTLHVTVIVEAP